MCIEGQKGCASFCLDLPKHNNFYPPPFHMSVQVWSPQALHEHQTTAQVVTQLHSLLVAHSTKYIKTSFRAKPEWHLDCVEAGIQIIVHLIIVINVSCIHSALSASDQVELWSVYSFWLQLELWAPGAGEINRRCCSSSHHRHHSRVISSV